jgi:Spy/CpxP family protein refolding chaperone
MLISVPAVADDAAPCPLGLEGGPGMHGQGHRGAGPLGRMADELGLTDEQKAEIRAIMAEEMPAARQRIEERVAGVLTEEQQARLAELKEEHPGMMSGRRGPGKGRGMRGPGGPGARLERMAEALDLTDEQKTAVRELFAEARQEKRDEMHEKISALLTPEQQEKLDELRSEREARMAERGGQ